MAEDPRIIDQMRRQAFIERPMPKDMRELMETAVRGDPESIRLIQEHLDIENIDPVVYAQNWLRRSGIEEPTWLPTEEEEQPNQDVAVSPAAEIESERLEKMVPDVFDPEKQKHKEVERLKKLMQAMDLKDQEEGN